MKQKLSLGLMFVTLALGLATMLFTGALAMRKTEAAPASEASQVQSQSSGSLLLKDETTLIVSDAEISAASPAAENTKAEENTNDGLVSRDDIDLIGAFRF